MDEKYKTYMWRKAKKLYRTHFAPLLSLFFLLRCVLGTKNVAKWGRSFFCALRAQIETRFACELPRRVQKKKRFAHRIIYSYFHNFMFLKTLPHLGEIL